MSDDNWKHRSATMTCATCMWFVAKERATLGSVGVSSAAMARQNETDGMSLQNMPSIAPTHASQRRLGRCRRHAPTLGGWPAIYDADWCGDHKLDENKL